MRFLIVNQGVCSKWINVDRVVCISAYEDYVLISYDVGGDCATVKIQTKYPKELADYIINLILNGVKVIDLRDIDKVKFIRASELAGKSDLIVAQ